MMKKITIDIIIGLFLMSLGTYFMAIGLEVVTDENVFVELWVMFFLGLLLVFVGVVLVTGKKLEKKSFITSMMLLCFSMVGFGMGYFGDTSAFQKWIFGLSSSICFGLSIIAFNGKSNDKKTN